MAHSNYCVDKIDAATASDMGQGNHPMIAVTSEKESWLFSLRGHAEGVEIRMLNERPGPDPEVPDDLRELIERRFACGRCVSWTPSR